MKIRKRHSKQTNKQTKNEHELLGSEIGRRVHRILWPNKCSQGHFYCICTLDTTTHTHTHERKYDRERVCAECIHSWWNGRARALKHASTDILRHLYWNGQLNIITKIYKRNEQNGVWREQTNAPDTNTNENASNVNQKKTTKQKPNDIQEVQQIR